MTTTTYTLLPEPLKTPQVLPADPATPWSCSTAASLADTPVRKSPAKRAARFSAVDLTSRLEAVAHRRQEDTCYRRQAKVLGWTAALALSCALGVVSAVVWLVWAAAWTALGVCKAVAVAWSWAVARVRVRTQPWEAFEYASVDEELRFARRRGSHVNTSVVATRPAVVLALALTAGAFLVLGRMTSSWRH